MIGTVLSYINTFLGMFITIFMVPMLLAACGESEYSVYKVMSSMAAPMSMMNLGIAAYVSRAMAQCNQKNKLQNNSERQQILGLSIVIGSVLCISAAVVAGCLYQQIPVIYANTFTATELLLAQKLYVILAINICVNIFGNGFQGCIAGNEKFIVAKVIALGKTILRAVCIVVIVLLDWGTMMVAACDMGLSILVMGSEWLYVAFGLRERYRFDHFEKTEFKIFFTFALSMLMQTVVNSINNSLDTVLLGAMVVDKTVITMYSSALTIYHAFISISYTISGIFQPSIVRAVTAELPADQLLKKAVVPAKWQAIVSSAIILGFILFGENFIAIWIGEKYIAAYYVALSLMIPSYLVSISGVYEAFLDAKLKRLVRSLILFGMAIGNAVVSFVLIQIIGYWGAAIGTVSSLVIGNLFVMNGYSARVSGVPVLKLYKGAFSGIWKALLLTLILCVPLSLFLPQTVEWFAVKIFIYMSVYFVAIVFVGEPDIGRYLLKRRQSAA